MKPPRLRLIQTCVIQCIKRSRVGWFNTCKKRGQLENSLSYCILCSPSERALRVGRLGLVVKGLTFTMTRVHDTARWISYILFLAQLYFVSKNAGWRILRRNILNCSWESTLRYSIPRCWPFRHFFSELWSFAKFDRKIFSLIKVALLIWINVRDVRK